MVVVYVYVFSMVVYEWDVWCVVWDVCCEYGVSGVMLGFGWHYINVLSHDSHASTGGEL